MRGQRERLVQRSDLQALPEEEARGQLLSRLEIDGWRRRLRGSRLS